MRGNGKQSCGRILTNVREPLVLVLLSYYWTLFAYIVLGRTFSQHKGSRSLKTELNWWSQGFFYNNFNMSDIAGGTIGWSRNKYDPGMPWWRGSRLRVLFDHLFLPLQLFLTEVLFIYWKTNK